MPLNPEEQRTRRRRTALIAIASVTTGALLLAGLTWTAMNTVNRLRDWETAASSTPPPKTSARSSASSSSSPAATPASEADNRAPGLSDPSSAAPEPPKALPYPGIFLNRKNSLNIKEGVERSGRKGDIRFDCKEVGCELESDTSALALLPGDPGASLDDCRLALSAYDTDHADDRRVLLAAAAGGSEICVKHPSGDIALLVLQVKSTAMPEIGFITMDMTVWRAA